MVTWEAELTCDYPGSRISWRSIQGALTSEAGSVRFINAPTRGVTEVHVTLEYEATLSAYARCVARLFRSEPGAELADDLRMLKHSLEQSATHNAMLPEEHAFATVSHAG